MMRPIPPVTRENIEAELWRWSEWKARKQGVEALLNVIDLYVEGLKLQASPLLCIGCQGAVREAEDKRQERASRPSKRARVPETDRKCRDCGIVKGIDRFNKDVKSRNGRKAQCKACEAGQRKDRRAIAKAQSEGKRSLSIKV